MIHYKVILLLYTPVRLLPLIYSSPSASAQATRLLPYPLHLTRLLAHPLHLIVLEGTF